MLLLAMPGEREIYDITVQYLFQYNNYLVYLMQ